MSPNHITIDCVNEKTSSIIPHHVKLCTQYNHNLVFKITKKEIKALITNDCDANQYFAHYTQRLMNCKLNRL